MKNKLSISIILVLFIASTLMICSPTMAEDKNTPNRKIDISRHVENRIDRLTMLIADKADQGVDTKEAENLLLEAIDLFDDKNYEKSMEKLKDVERALGLEPLDFQDRRKDGMRGDLRRDDRQRDDFRMGPDSNRKPFIKVEMSDSEKKAALSEIKELMSATQRLMDEGKLEEAFKKLCEAHRKLADVSGIRPPRMGDGQGRMGPGGLRPKDGFGPRDGRPNGPSMNDQQRFNKRPEQNLKMIFEKARENGNDGFDKLSERFGGLLERLKGRGVDYNAEAEDHYNQALKLRKKDDLENAFDELEKAYELIKNSTDRPLSPREPGMKGDQRKPQGQGKKLNSDEYQKMKNAAQSLKDVYQEYIEKNERDEFIETCFDEFNQIRKKMMRGEIEVDNAVELIDALTKKIKENI